MNNLMDYFFGPLSKEYCVYYYVMSVISAIVFAVTLVSFIFTLSKTKQIKFSTILFMSNFLVSTFIGYFVSRLLYSMCIRSL